MPVSIPQLQDKMHRVCSYCRFKKVKCTGGDPCETCKNDDKICMVYRPLEDQRRTYIRQGCLNTHITAQCMLHQALVDIIQQRKIPDVPAKALSSPHALLSAMGVIDEKDNAAWKDNLRQPWARLVSNMAITHPTDKKDRAPRGSKEAPAKQGVVGQQQPACPDTPAPGFPVAAQDPRWYNAAAVAPAQQHMGYDHLFTGHAHGHAVESTFNSALPSAAFPPAPGRFAGFSQANPILLDSPPLPAVDTAQGYGALPAYAAPQPTQWQQQQQQWQQHQQQWQQQWQRWQQQQQQWQPAATPAPVPAPASAMPAATAAPAAPDAPIPDLPDFSDFSDLSDLSNLFPELSSNGTFEPEEMQLDGQTDNQVLSTDDDAAGPGEAQFTEPGEGLDQADFEMGMELINWNLLN